MELKLGERLTELMEERGISNEQLAEKTGIAVQTIRRWKKNASKIYLSNLIKICDVLQCSLEFLVGRTEAILDFKPQTCPSFYSHLREVMEEKCKTRYRIVQDTKIYDNYFTVWKRGRDPQLDTLIELANYLECTIDYLVGREI